MNSSIVDRQRLHVTMHANHTESSIAVNTCNGITEKVTLDQMKICNYYKFCAVKCSRFLSFKYQFKALNEWSLIPVFLK